MTALLLTLLAAVPGVAILLAWCWVNRKPTPVETCGDPSCEACALLSGKWPKYNPGPRERVAMGFRRQMKQQSAHAREFAEARGGGVVPKQVGILIALFLGVRGAYYLWAVLRWPDVRRNAWGEISKRRAP
jgi:hypothetical protein